ncbi:MAG TPA: response regulator [Phototrophicaceae bacterium]|jgi:CheY-like chemotaxis protein|nr:response regulator [Phototrophicaceae bacterium]
MALIVVIEDNPQNARLAAKLLRNAGHQVLIAEDGEVGLITVFEHQPSLVLVDLGLPDMDGQTVIVMMRQYEGLKNTRFIAFTAWPADTAHNMARAYGCDGVIVKPINTRTFVEEVEVFLKGDEKQPA